MNDDMTEAINQTLLVHTLFLKWNLAFNLDVLSSRGTIMMWYEDGATEIIESMGFRQIEVRGGHTEFESKDYPLVRLVVCTK